MSLFEDPKLEYYREWDRKYDERQAQSEDALVFTYDSGEKALAAAKNAVKRHPTYRFHCTSLPDGTLCFEVVEDNKVIERHCV